MRSSNLTRLEKLEEERHFVNWFLATRFIESLNENELILLRQSAKLPDPAPNRPSKLDRLSRASLIKLCQEDRQRYEGRTRDDLQSFSEHGLWPEQRGRLHYSNYSRGLHVEWQETPPNGDQE